MFQTFNSIVGGSQNSLSGGKRMLSGGWGQTHPDQCGQNLLHATAEQTMHGQAHITSVIGARALGCDSRIHDGYLQAVFARVKP